MVANGPPKGGRFCGGSRRRAPSTDRSRKDRREFKGPVAGATVTARAGARPCHGGGSGDPRRNSHNGRTLPEPQEEMHGCRQEDGEEEVAEKEGRCKART